MNWGLVLNDWRLKLLAFVLAVLMLAVVAFSQNPPTTKSLTVGLNYQTDTSAGIVLINPPSKTTVTYSGLADVIARVDPSNLVITVDATKAKTGSAVKLNLNATSLINGVTVQNPGQIAVNIDTLAPKSLPVQVSARAAPGWSITKAVAKCPGSATPDPCQVQFTGPLSWESNLTATVVVPGAVNVGTISTLNQRIQLANGNGALDLGAVRTIPLASLDVSAVNVQVEAKTGVTSSTVPLVDSPPSNSPPSGYRVTGITITPVTVVITGDAAVLGRIRSLTLPPVDLSNSTSDAVFQVAIPYPNGVDFSVQNATVRYTITRNPNVSPSPA